MIQETTPNTETPPPVHSPIGNEGRRPPINTNCKTCAVGRGHTLRYPRVAAQCPFPAVRVRKSLVCTMDSAVYATPATSSRPESSAGNVFAHHPFIATRPAAEALLAGRHGLTSDGNHQPVVAHSLPTTGSPEWFRLDPVADVRRDGMRWRLSVAACPVDLPCLTLQVPVQPSAIQGMSAPDPRTIMPGDKRIAIVSIVGAPPASPDRRIGSRQSARWDAQPVNMLGPRSARTAETRWETEIAMDGRVERGRAASIDGHESGSESLRR